MYRAPIGLAGMLTLTQSIVGGSNSHGAPSTIMLSTNQPCSEAGEGVPVLFDMIKRSLQFA